MQRARVVTGSSSPSVLLLHPGYWAGPRMPTACYRETDHSQLQPARVFCHSPPTPQVLDRPEFTKSMLEKLVWICAFMLVGARHGGCTVGEVESQVGGACGRGGGGRA